MKNVLMLSVDDMTAFVTLKSLYPGQISTPNIDRLMSMGTTFTEAFCQTALCNPSRTSLLTGQLPTTTQVFRNDQGLVRVRRPCRHDFFRPQLCRLSRCQRGKTFSHPSHRSDTRLV
jgi:arylsulfatase A-like enzyme